MRKILAIIVLSSLTFIFGCKRELVIPELDGFFLKYYGESGNDAAYDLKVTGDGGFLFCGYTTTKLGDKNAYIAKANQFGYIEWSKSIGEDLDDQFNEIVLADQIYVVGTSEDSITGKDIRLNVFDYNGKELGEKIYNIIDDQEGNSIGISGNFILLAGSDTRANNVVLGTAAGTNPQGIKDLFILKVENIIDNENDIYFPYKDHFQAGGRNNDEIKSIIIKEGQILASGKLNYTNQKGGKENLGIDNDNIAIINLLVNTLDVPPYDGYGTEEDDICNKIIFNSKGELILVGGENSLLDPFILKIDDVSRLGDYNTSFNLDFKDEGITVLNDIYETVDGGYILVGSTDGEGNGNKDLLLIKIASNGSKEWHNTYGGGGDEIGYSVAESGDGYVVLGTTKLGVDDDDTDQEIMLLKVTSTGELK